MTTGTAPAPALIRRAFTLLEMLVALAVSSLLVVLFAYVVSGILSNYKGVREGARMEREATMALNAMASELGSLVFSGSPESQSLRVQIESVNGRTFPVIALLAASPGTDSRFGEVPATCLVLTWTAFGNPAASGGRDPRWVLYRNQLDAAAIYSEGKAPGDLIASARESVPPLLTPAPELVLADQIAALEFDFLLSDSSVVALRNAGDGIGITPRGIVLDNAQQGAGDKNLRCVAVKIKLVLLDERGVFLAREGMIQQDELIRHARTFTRTIPLPQPM